MAIRPSQIRECVLALSQRDALAMTEALSRSPLRHQRIENLFLSGRPSVGPRLPTIRSLTSPAVLAALEDPNRTPSPSIVARQIPAPFSSPTSVRGPHPP